MTKEIEPLRHLSSRNASSSGYGIPRNRVRPTRVSFVSNDYLGLMRHPETQAAAIRAIKTSGLGAASARPSSLWQKRHDLLERKIAAFKGTDSALLYQSGFVANLGVIPSVVQAGDVVLADELNHASSKEGGRLSGAEVHEYRHVDVDHLRALLRRVRAKRSDGHRSVLVVTDGVFGSEGDVAPLSDICAVAGEYEAATYVDDAHGTGVMGPGGRGTVSHFGVEGRVDVQVGTLSKAIGGAGGYATGPDYLRQLLLERSLPVLYSTLSSPALVAGAIASIDVLSREPERVDRLRANATLLRKILQERGFDTGRSEAAIVPIMLPSDSVAIEFGRRSADAGVRVQVTQRTRLLTPRVRLVVTAQHRPADLIFAGDCFSAIRASLLADGAKGGVEEPSRSCAEVRGERWPL